MNFLLKNKSLVKQSILEGERLYTDHHKEILVPFYLDEISVSPLCMTRVQDYLILHASMPNSLTNHWLCKFTGTLMSEKRELQILVHIEEWINYEYPAKEPKDAYKGWRRRP